jgi:hypothetical protein
LWLVETVQLTPNSAVTITDGNRGREPTEDRLLRRPPDYLPLEPCTMPGSSAWAARRSARIGIP